MITLAVPAELSGLTYIEIGGQQFPVIDGEVNVPHDHAAVLINQGYGYPLGPTGPTGPRGATGVTGPEGPTGVPLASVLTTAGRTGISGPAPGRMVYDTDKGVLCVYDGAAWRNSSGTNVDV